VAAKCMYAMGMRREHVTLLYRAGKFLSYLLDPHAPAQTSFKLGFEYSYWPLRPPLTKLSTIVSQSESVPPGLHCP
jgi:hypothetical protein